MIFGKKRKLSFSSNFLSLAWLLDIVTLVICVFIIIVVELNNVIFIVHDYTENGSYIGTYNNHISLINAALRNTKLCCFFLFLLLKLSESESEWTQNSMINTQFFKLFDR